MSFFKTVIVNKFSRRSIRQSIYPHVKEIQKMRARGRERGVNDHNQLKTSESFIRSRSKGPLPAEMEDYVREKKVKYYHFVERETNSGRNLPDGL